ncbi:MAG: sigma-70 family RNA polymerase sigma factor [Deltaproteobacteria bacterium]|nr:sigma-70 family RNA polymerase sigma factor [Deltaproteobacteria bacterium]
MKREAPLDSLPDEQLMFRLARGEMESLGVLYERYDSLVKAALRRSAPEFAPADVDEFVQDVFLVLRDTAKRYQEQARLKAWLYGIAVKKARRWRDKERRRRRLLGQHRQEGVAMAWQTNTSPSHRAEIRERVSQALAALPENLRDVLVLSAVEGFTGEEIARILGVRPKTVWTRLHRARFLLQKSVPSEATVASGIEREK